ncbi:MAG: bifunctional phosphopantothenoylcysteine decarboxylase/phosphopantothenate--cysteine ligase CoaBC [Bacteroidota bacterium]
MLQGKRIVLGVCGSIAAYKAAHLTRLLIKAGAEVQIIMTASAFEFITPLTLATLSKNPVLKEFVKDNTGTWNNHVELGLWADLLLIAPASANTISKMAHGQCDNLLLATYLSAKCPVWVAPAMDLDMYIHPATSNNLTTLESFGNHIIKAEYGELASGIIGEGRLAEPEHIVEVVGENFRKSAPLSGKKILITAGPTHEAIDPVRFIGNNSSGKMGYAIAEEAARNGAQVHLVSGPSAEKVSHPNIVLEKVNSAEEMYKACMNQFESTNVSVLAAAVADYKPATIAAQKIKKQADSLKFELIKTRDIAAELGAKKTEEQLIVGFALETEDEIENAKKKIKTKNFDLIVLNSLNHNGAGFGYDTNKISILDKENNQQDFQLKSKKEVAKDIVDAIIKKIHS